MLAGILSPPKLLRKRGFCQFEYGERTRRACGFPRPPRKLRSHKEVPEDRAGITRKRAGREACPATPGASVLPNFIFGISLTFWATCPVSSLMCRASDLVFYSVLLLPRNFTRQINWIFHTRKAFMSRLSAPLDRVKPVFQIMRYFKNPWLIILLRLGVIRLPYFLYRIGKGNRSYAILARPTTTSMADLFVLREVLVEEGYKDVLPLLKRKNIRLLDIGANLGSFTIWMHRVLGVREAFCFEPEPDSFRLLNFNLLLNDCTTAKTAE